METVQATVGKWEERQDAKKALDQFPRPGYARDGIDKPINALRSASNLAYVPEAQIVGGEDRQPIVVNEIFPRTADARTSFELAAQYFPPDSSIYRRIMGIADEIPNEPVTRDVEGDDMIGVDNKTFMPQRVQTLNLIDVITPLEDSPDSKEVRRLEDVIDNKAWGSVLWGGAAAVEGVILLGIVNGEYDAGKGRKEYRDRKRAEAELEAAFEQYRQSRESDNPSEK